METSLTAPQPQKPRSMNPAGRFLLTVVFLQDAMAQRPPLHICDYTFLYNIFQSVATGKYTLNRVGKFSIIVPHGRIPHTCMEKFKFLL